MDYASVKWDPAATTWMVDQSPRHDCSPDAPSAKLARARAYLRERNIDALAQGNRFRYWKADHGSAVLRHLVGRGR